MNEQLALGMIIDPMAQDRMTETAEQLYNSSGDVKIRSWQYATEGIRQSRVGTRKSIVLYASHEKNKNMG